MIKYRDEIVGRGIVDDTSLYCFVMDEWAFLLNVIEFLGVVKLWHKGLVHLNAHSVWFLSTKELVCGIKLIPTNNTVCSWKANL